MSHVSRVMADNCLRIYVALEFARLVAEGKQSAWHLVTLLLMLPAVLFAPFNGAICNSLPKPRVLIGSGLVALVIAAVAYASGSDASGSATALLVGWGLVAVTAAINGPVRYAFL